MRRAERAAKAVTQDQFDKETDQGAGIVETTLVEIISSIVSGLLPPLQRRMPNSWKDRWNPLKRNTPPATPPAMPKGANNSPTQLNPQKKRNSRVPFLSKAVKWKINIDHIEKGEIKIKQIDSRTGSVVDTYTYQPGRGGQAAQKGYNYQVEVGGCHDYSYVDGVFVREVSRNKVGTLPNGEDINAVELEFYVRELNQFKKKSLPSTMFPPSWDRNMKIQAITEASQNIITSSGRLHTGETSAGIRIDFWLSKSGSEIESA
jgi:hypothetical protein